MPSNESNVRSTSKTEFMRWLDNNQGRGTSLEKHINQYLINSRNRHTFGQWVRVKHADNFNSAYDNFWLKNPELFDVVYEQNKQQ